jgi:hypothetical protein
MPAEEPLAQNASNRNINFAEARLLAALQQIDLIAESEFTFSDGPKALGLIRKKLKKHLTDVASLRTDGVADPKIIRAECHRALQGVDTVLPILGLIVRSTDIRNAFEIYGPIRQLAKLLVTGEKDSKPCLIWSSGWDYVPMTFRRIKYLPGFVIITIPSSEAANPLLVPLAGHELGHRLWTDEKLEKRSSKPILEGVARFVQANYKQAPDQIRTLPKKARNTVESLTKYLTENSYRFSVWNLMLLNATRQTEEFFCDLIGYFLFGESFVHAFAYLLSPRPPHERWGEYPAMRARAALLIDARAKFATDVSDAYTIPDDFAELFAEEEQADFWARCADDAAIAAARGLIDVTIEFSRRDAWKKLPELSTSRRKEIKNHWFAWGVPPENAGSLGNILNAAWDATLDEKFWESFPPFQLQPEAKRAAFRVEALREIVLKSIEVFEYELIQKTHQTK